MPRSKRSGGSKWAKFIAGLSRIVGDVGHAEDLAQALYWGALGRWPEFGVPDNAEAWLTATTKHRAIGRVDRGGPGPGQRREPNGLSAVAFWYVGSAFM